MPRLAGIASTTPPAPSSDPAHSPPATAEKWPSDQVTSTGSVKIVIALAIAVKLSASAREPGRSAGSTWF